MARKVVHVWTRSALLNRTAKILAVEGKTVLSLYAVFEKTRFYGFWINFFRPFYNICWQDSSVSFLFCCSWSWNRKSLQIKILGKVSFGISVWKMRAPGNSKSLKQTREKLLQLWLFQIRSLFVEFVITIKTYEKTFSTLDVCWGWRRRPLCNVKLEVMNISHNFEVNFSCCTN